ncbi:TauD/TfdA family dioxygenase [Rosenbergiella epipactidis]|uniref:TauD/TfdA family dioxygenase n=1 Tax=Rosenbergiella epipactidis TaxID=1544694 RepID=UPI001F4F2661|nr:TauD/TfdA family dioxygenase [Rosenbergiella epipactidis]
MNINNNVILLKSNHIRGVLPLTREKFNEILHSESYIIWKIKDFDTHELADTPVKSPDAQLVELKNSDLHGAYLSAHFDAGIWPVVYQGENNGHLIRHVCPLKTAEGKISSQGGKFDFYPHVDNPDLKITGEDSISNIGNCPDTLTLLCLRAEPGVNTSLLQLDKVIEVLPEDVVQTLSKPLYRVKRPDSFEGSLSVEMVPVLVKSNDTWYSRFDWHNINGLSAEAEMALEKMRAVTLDKNLWLDIPLHPGEAVTFLNQRTLHTRNSFNPRYDGTDRWLLRIFGLMNRPPISHLLEPHVCLHHLRTFL